MIEKELMGLWLNSLASKAPVPGGGGASAIGGALAAALGQMVANLTVGKKKYADVEKIMQELLGKLQALQEDFLDLADQDAKALRLWQQPMPFRHPPRKKSRRRYALWRKIFWLQAWYLFT